MYNTIIDFIQFQQSKINKMFFPILRDIISGVFRHEFLYKKRVVLNYSIIVLSLFKISGLTFYHLFIVT